MALDLTCYLGVRRPSRYSQINRIVALHVILIAPSLELGLACSKFKHAASQKDD